MKHSTMLLITAAMLTLSTATAFADKKKQLRTAVFHVEISCEGCVKKIQNNIAFEKGVKDMRIDPKAQTVTLVWDEQKTDTATLKTAFEKIKKPVSRIELKQTAEK